jgi:hypothetical protein
LTFGLLIDTILSIVAKATANPKQVLIEVRGGVAEVVRAPGNVEVVLHDYDVDGSEAGSLKKDANGKFFVEYVHRATRRTKWD